MDNHVYDHVTRPLIESVVYSAKLHEKEQGMGNSFVLRDKENRLYELYAVLNNADDFDKGHTLILSSNGDYAHYSQDEHKKLWNDWRKGGIFPPAKDELLLLIQMAVESGLSEALSGAFDSMTRDERDKHLEVLAKNIFEGTNLQTYQKVK